MISSLLLLLTIVLSILLFYKGRKAKFSTLGKLKINGPKPNLILGNNKAFYTHPLNFVSNLLKEYGDICGFYIGPIPVIVTKDLEIIKDVLIRKFDNFVNRTRYPLLEVFPFQHSLLSLRDDRWRLVRSVLSPFFTVSKMKRCTATITSMSNVFVKSFNKNVEECIDVYLPAQRLVLDVLFSCVLGVELNLQENTKSPLYEAFKSFSGDMRSWILKLGYVFPVFRWVSCTLARYIQSGIFLTKIQMFVSKVIEYKKGTNFYKTSDFLSLILQYNDKSSTKRKDRLSVSEIIGAALSFLVVGFDTTASSIAYCIYLLSQNLKEQDKLCDEITRVISEEGELTYETIMYRMPYLDQVYKESLRMYSPFPVFCTRECKETCTLNGVTIPAGSSVMVPINELHYDESIWEEPTKFKPSRFSPENACKIPPLAYQPFADGSRNCIGKNLGILISKVAVAKLVCRYRLRPAGQDMPKLESGITTSAVHYPKNGAHVTLKMRE